MSETHNKPTLGAIFRQKREEKGLLVRQVAAVTAMDQALVSRIENGDRLPTREQLNKLAGLYDLDLKETYSAWLAERMVRDYGDEPFAPEAFREAHDNVILKHVTSSETIADYLKRFPKHSDKTEQNKKTPRKPEPPGSSST